MKLRIQGNSLRIRVSEAELDQFRETGQVEEAIAFGPAAAQKLRYVLLKTPAYNNLQVTFTQNKVIVHVPESTAINWANSEQNGFEGFIDNGTPKGLRILVQKDLDCLH